MNHPIFHFLVWREVVDAAPVVVVDAESGSGELARKLEVLGLEAGKRDGCGVFNDWQGGAAQRHEYTCAIARA
jgi:hypothetical protein